MRIIRVYPHKPGLTKFLGSIEVSVMLAVWGGEQAVSSIYKHIMNEDGEEYSYSTILTVIKRLWKKGLLVRVREGKRDLYSATYPSESAFIEYCISETLRGICEDYDIELREVYDLLKAQPQ